MNKTRTLHINGATRTIIVPTKKHPLVVKISRRRWHRGKMPGKSKLLLPGPGRMCCLGFDALALGFKKRDISGKFSPSSLDVANIPGLTHKKAAIQTDTCRTLVNTNDSPTISDATRERRLKHYARKINRKFVFVP